MYNRRLQTPVQVGFATTGSPGDWTIDLLVMNNLAGAPDQALYLFGVLLSVPNVAGSPANYDPTLIGTWDNRSFGGSSLQYNNVWVDGSTSHLLPGTFLWGFQVRVPDAVAPVSIPWFAYTVGNAPNLGGGNFNDPSKPGFEGSASPVPESGLGLLPAAALGGFLLVRRRSRAAVV